jgi:hypothetical protein
MAKDVGGDKASGSAHSGRSAGPVTSPPFSERARVLCPEQTLLSSGRERVAKVSNCSAQKLFVATDTSGSVNC